MPFEGTIQEFPEFSQSREALLARAARLSWYHTLDLDPTLRTQGIFDLHPYVPYYVPVERLDGLRCLEIGSGNGFWAFEMERRGGEVTTLDLADYTETDFSTRFGVDNGRPPHRALPGAFGEPLRVAAVLRGSSIRYRLGSVYDVQPDTHGEFDVVFSGSMLMHLFSPLLALRRMASVCRDACLITTQTDPTLEPQNVLAYRGHEIPYVHFIPSPTCLQSMLISCGYERVLRGPTFILRFRDRNNPMPIPHTAFVALRRAGATRLALPDETQSITGAGVRLDLAGDPPALAPNRPFAVTVRVSNLAQRSWYFPDQARSLAAVLQIGRHRAAEVQVADYLPAGTGSLVVLHGVMPASGGPVRVALEWAGRPIDGAAVALNGNH
jgi:tRNA (mo5U34)-methyltransferase